jgi:hypothetical protein
MVLGHFRRREHLMFDHNLHPIGKWFSRLPRRPRRAKALPGAGPRLQVERLEDRTLLSATNLALVAQMYQDLLQRSPDAGGLANWTTALDQGASPSQVALELAQSPEGRALQVQTLYQQFLHRAVDPTGLSAFTKALAAGQKLEDVAAAMVGSPEYYQDRGGGSDNGFLSAMYQDALNRPTDGIGAATFGQALAGGMSRAQVAEAVFGSPELQQDIVQRDYQYFLHRAADAAGLANCTQALQHGMRDEQIAAAIVGSQEYTQTAQNAGGSLQQTLLPDNGPTFNALVVNTPSQPVPITGSLGVNGTVQAQQSGVWMVGISNTPTVNIGNSVQVASSANNPVYVSDVNNNALQPYQITLDPRAQGGNPSSVTVPQHKRLVIEDVSAFASLSPGARGFFIVGTQLTGQAFSTNHFVPLSFAYTDGTYDYLIAHQQTMWYADPGTTVGANVQFQPNPGLFVTDVYLSGYLVNVP